MTTTVQPLTPPVKSSDATRLPPKSVQFTWSESGGWSCEPRISDSKFFFTERDWNQISILLNVKRAYMRRLGAMAYHAAQREQKSVIPLPVKKV